MVLSHACVKVLKPIVFEMDHSLSKLPESLFVVRFESGRADHFWLAFDYEVTLESDGVG